MYVVGFNGPPRCGKDTMAQMLADWLDEHTNLPVRQVSLSMPLRRIAYAMVGFTGKIDGPDYEAFKVLKYEAFGWATGRQIMIDVSEKFLKPAYGLEVMARMLLADNRDMGNGIILIRDSGFQVEIDPIAREVGADNLFIERVIRPGCIFNDDSREWVTHQFMGTTPNVGTLDDLRVAVSALGSTLINRMGWKF